MTDDRKSYDEIEDFFNLPRGSLIAAPPGPYRYTPSASVEWLSTVLGDGPDLSALRAEDFVIAELVGTLRLPIWEDPETGPPEGFFNPWKLFPALYGSYDSAFSECALGVLSEIAQKAKGDYSGPHDESLAADMLREMLCTQGLCDYGTSPRTCFASKRFSSILPLWIEKWRANDAIQWGDQC